MEGGWKHVDDLVSNRRRISRLDARHHDFLVKKNLRRLRKNFFLSRVHQSFLEKRNSNVVFHCHRTDLLFCLRRSWSMSAPVQLPLRRFFLSSPVRSLRRRRRQRLSDMDHHRHHSFCNPQLSAVPLWPDCRADSEILPNRRISFLDRHAAFFYNRYELRSNSTKDADNMARSKKKKLTLSRRFRRWKRRFVRRFAAFPAKARTAL